MPSYPNCPSELFLTTSHSGSSHVSVLWIYQHCWSVAFLSPHLFWFHFPPYLATLLHVNILYFLPCLAETKLDHCFLSSYIHWLKDLQVKNKTNIFRRKQRCISIWHWEGLLTTQKAQTMKEDEWQYRVWETYVANKYRKRSLTSVAIKSIQIKKHQNTISNPSDWQ